MNKQTLGVTTLEGIAKTLDSNMAQKSETQMGVKGQSFASSVENALQNFFAKLDGEQPAQVYQMVLAEMELPLLKTVMTFTSGNQSKAAKILGLSRGTLRKKLAIYKIEEE